MSDFTIIMEKIFRKGAEASLYYGHWFNNEVIFKYRVPKEYRIEELDLSIRTARTINEGKALIKVKNYGVCVPQVYEIDTKNSTIIMKYIKGDKLKELIPHLNDDEKKAYFNQLGKFIAILHMNGHIHGDITTSNIIITPEKELFLIDFGLHEYSDSIEDKSVDIHLLKRALLSTHGEYFEKCYPSFLQGYREQYGVDKTQESNQIIDNIEVIESRGRYVKKKERK